MAITMSTHVRDLFSRMNWGRINQAKGSLIWLMNRTPKHFKPDILLLVRLLDSLQEFAVKVLGYDEDVVWGTMEKAQ